MTNFISNGISSERECRARGPTVRGVRGFLVFQVLHLYPPCHPLTPCLSREHEGNFPIRPTYTTTKVKCNSTKRGQIAYPFGNTATLNNMQANRVKYDGWDGLLGRRSNADWCKVMA